MKHLWFQFDKCKVKDILSSYITVYEGSFGLGLFVGQKKSFEEVTLGSRKL